MEWLEKDWQPKKIKIIKNYGGKKC